LKSIDAAGRIAQVPKRRIWRWLGVAISVAIVVAAFATLVRLLHDIEPTRVLAALQTTSWRTIVVAALFVTGGYFTLTFYDYFALRTIGRSDVPYRVAALTGFASYSIGHNLGATVLTAGAVRYRIYSAWGVSLVEVAKIAFITGLTFWLGNAFLLGAGMAYAPEAASAIDRLPPWINRAIGLAGLAVIIAYLMWLIPRPRVIGRDGWQVTLPNARLTGVQIAIGALDLGFCALAMYTLLPEAPPTDLLPFAVTFVIATLLGFLSHAPGSIGVLDAALLVSLPAFEKEGLLASLLIFRALYFLLPFIIALLMLGLRELWLAVRGTDSSGSLRL
jgi:glycosyltransferase 2 family protein